MSAAKTLRKQLRNICQELLPEALNSEFNTSLRKEVMAHVDKRLDAIAAHIKQTLESIDQRSKDISAYNIRNSAANLPYTPEQK